MEQTLRRTHRHQSAHFSRAARLAEDGDVVRVAAEIGDVVVDPLERGYGVQDAAVACVLELFAADFGEIEKTKRIEAVIDGDRHDVVLVRHVAAVVHGVAAVAAGESAAMQPNHDRALMVVQAVGPDVEVQAVLTDGNFGDGGGDFGDLGVRTLGRLGAPFDGVFDAAPGCGFRGRHESICPAGGRAVGNATEGENLVFLHDAADFA